MTRWDTDAPPASLSHDSPRLRFTRRMAGHDPALRLYAILDGESCRSRNLDLFQVAKAWREAGVQLVQYRDKEASEQTLLRNAVALRNLFPPGDAFLILNDYPYLVAPCGFDGVHVGQADATCSQARDAIGPDRILGVSTHSPDQALSANATATDYVAIGPVFPTTTKADAEPAVGICGVQAARALVGKPLVAIGGITLDSARSVQNAGADAIALISALLTGDHPVGVAGRAQDFLARLQ